MTSDLAAVPATDCGEGLRLAEWTLEWGIVRWHGHCLDIPNGNTRSRGMLSRQLSLLGWNQDPEPGTHLATSRRGYTHHGIYVGNGMVVHYAGLSRFLHSGPVEEVTMSIFSMGRPVRVIGHRESTYSTDEI